MTTVPQRTAPTANERVAARIHTAKAIGALAALLLLDRHSVTGVMTAEDHNQLSQALETLRALEPDI